MTTVWLRGVGATAPWDGWVLAVDGVAVGPPVAAAVVGAAVAAPVVGAGGEVCGAAPPPAQAASTALAAKLVTPKAPRERRRRVSVGNEGTPGVVAIADLLPSFTTSALRRLPLCPRPVPGARLRRAGGRGVGCLEGGAGRDAGRVRLPGHGGGDACGAAGGAAV